MSKEGSKEKVIICNVSEGEPGTCKDRFLLLECPEAVIEGMAVCALAVGARRGYVYIRAGYEDVAESVRRALENALPRLGELKIAVMENMGAYICGEETALTASLSGRRGEPAKKPPYPTVSGLNGVPTVINNAETFAAALIASDGADSFVKNLQGSTALRAAEPSVLSVSCRSIRRRMKFSGLRAAVEM